MRPTGSVAALIVLCGMGSMAQAVDAPRDRPRFATGAALDEKLRSIASVSWSKIPLSQALVSLSKAQDVAIVLDRRVDPDAALRLELPREPLSGILRKVAAARRLGYSQLGSVAYIGPPATAARLRTLAELRLEDVRSLSRDAARKLLTLRESHWDDLSEPRDLLNQLSAEAGVELAGAELMPHDLWAAADLPPLAWIDRLTLLAAQFDLTFRIDQGGRRVRLVQIPDDVGLARIYRAGGDAHQMAERIAAGLPKARVVEERDKVRVTALVEDHEWIERQLHGTPTRRTQVVPGKEVYQVTIESKPLDRVVEQVAGRLSLEFRWDRPAIDEARIAVDQLVSLKVEDADVDELLRAIFAGTGLAFRRADRVVSIGPADSEPPR